MNKNTIYNKDCLIGMSEFQNDSIDLIIADIPYNVTDNLWDKFDSKQHYIDFLGEFIFQCGRILKETGSLYIFHSEFNILCEIQNLVTSNTGLTNKRLIVWNKFFNGSEKQYLKNIHLNRDENNYQRYAEYILYYAFNEKKIVSTIQSNKENFHDYKKYIQWVLNRKNMTWNSKPILNILMDNFHYRTMQSTKSISQRLFSNNFKNFGLISRKQYEALYPILEFSKSYDELVELYNSGKESAIVSPKIDRVRTTFNNLASHHSVWNYSSPRNPSHPTQKPEELIENIILHSSNEGDLVLDPFFGSGVSIKQSIKLKREYVGFETDVKYFNDLKEELGK